MQFAIVLRTKEELLKDAVMAEMMNFKASSQWLWTEASFADWNYRGTSNRKPEPVEDSLSLVMKMWVHFFFELLTWTRISKKFLK